MGDLAKRVATAAVLVPALLAVIYLDPTPWSTLAFATAVAAVSLDEYLRMALPATADDRAIGLRLLTGLVGAAIVVFPTVWSLSETVAPVLTAGALLLATWVLGRKRQLEAGGRHVAVAITGLVYVSLLMAPLTLIKRDGSADWLVVTLCMTFFSDTVAYFFGRAWGRHKMYPAVSPKKTWEGSVGGLVGSSLAAVVVGRYWLLPELPLHHAAVLGVLASGADQVGDLVESMMKRTFGVKDSGKILPGHGGMLDRIDGLLFVAPVTYYYVMLVVR